MILGLVVPASLALFGTSASDAAELFASRCASCHTVPDSRFESDRAWLDQVKRTA